MTPAVRNYDELYDENLISFLDQYGTLFVRLAPGSEYYFGLTDDLGEDNCTYQQMKDWGVRVIKGNYVK